METFFRLGIDGKKNVTAIGLHYTSAIKALTDVKRVNFRRKEMGLKPAEVLCEFRNYRKVDQLWICQKFLAE